MYLCLHEGWQRLGCWMRILIVLLECFNLWRRSDRYWRDVPEMELKQIIEILYWMWYITGSERRVWKIGWMWSDFLAFGTNLAAFWTFWSLSNKDWGQPESRVMVVKSREDKRTNKGLASRQVESVAGNRWGIAFFSHHFNILVELVFRRFILVCGFRQCNNKSKKKKRKKKTKKEKNRRRSIQRWKI